jgi:hypothetical protein
MRGGCRLPRIAGPYHQTDVGHDERKSEREQYLRQLLTAQAPQQEALYERADKRHGAAADERGYPEIQTDALVEQRHAEIGAEHEERTVHQVGNEHQAEDQREAGGEQEQHSAKRNAVHGERQPEAHGITPRSPD